jgi:plasmid stabilization system protein ParE
LSPRLPVKFTPQAERQLDEAARWWRENRSKAPDALADDLAAALELIATQPAVGAIARNTRLSKLRRVYLYRIGYYLYYRVTTGDAAILQIVAFWHSSRGVGPHL